VAKARTRRAPAPQAGALPTFASEGEFQDAVVEVAHLYRWLVYHPRAVRLASGRWGVPMQGDAGLPDLVLARGGVVLLRELKTDTGVVEPQQERWLREAGSFAEVWRPADWLKIIAELSPVAGAPQRAGL